MPVPTVPGADRASATDVSRPPKRPRTGPSRRARRLLAALIAVPTAIATGVLAAPVPAGAAVGTLVVAQLTSPGGSVTMGDHLWIADHAMGFCRVDAGIVNQATCAGGATPLSSPGQPSFDAARNLVYVPENSAQSRGLARLAFDPATQTVGAPAFLNVDPTPSVTRPTATALASGGSTLYVGFGRSGAIRRVTSPATATAANPGAAASTFDGRGVSAMTLAGGGTDLYLAEGGGVTHVPNIAAANGVTAVETGVSAVAPSALSSDGGQVLYVAETPGAQSFVLRYNVATNTQDLFASGSGIGPFGTVTAIEREATGALIVGDDAVAGAVSFTGHAYRLAANAAPEAAGTPGSPAPLPVVTGPKVAALMATGLTSPGGLVTLGAGADRTVWVSDHAQGFCRLDPAPASPGGRAIAPSTCSTVATSPGQAVYDPDTHAVYLSDNATKSTGVSRLSYDPATHLVGSPANLAAPSAVGGRFSNALALGPDGNLYVGYIREGSIERITSPAGASHQLQTVGHMALVRGGAGVHGIAFVGSTLYLAEPTGVTAMANAAGCSACVAAALPGATPLAPSALTSDNAGTLYYADTPANNSTVYRYDVVTGTESPYATSGTASAGAASEALVGVSTLVLDDAGTLYVGDDLTLGAQVLSGRLWALATDTPLQPPIAQPVPSAPDLAPGSDTGRSNTDNVTSSTTPLLVGSATPGSTVRILADGAAVGSGGTDAAGTYRVTVSAIANGQHTLTAQATRGVRSSAVSGALTVGVDTVAPGVSITARPTATTFDHTPSFRFTTEAGALTECSIALKGAADSFAPCRSPFTSQELRDRSYAFVAHGIDAAGNTGTSARVALRLRSAKPRPGAPRVIERTPAAGATGVDRATDVDVRFTEPVKHISARTVWLTAQSGRRVATRLHYDRRGAIATLDPAHALGGDQRYTVHVSRAITDLGGSHASAISWRFTTGPRPTVSRVTPAASAVGVSRRASVTVVFSERVTGASGRTIRLVDRTSHRSVKAVVTYSARTRRAVLNPSGRLAARHRFTVSVSARVGDLAGNRLVARTWGFTTGR